MIRLDRFPPLDRRHRSGEGQLFHWSPRRDQSFPCRETFFSKFLSFYTFMVEPLLSGIVLGLVPVTLAGLFVTAYLQYRRGDRVTNSL